MERRRGAYLELYCTLGTHVIPAYSMLCIALVQLLGQMSVLHHPAAPCTVSVAVLDPAEVSDDGSAVSVCTGKGLGKDELQLHKRMISTRVRQISCALL